MSWLLIPCRLLHCMMMMTIPANIISKPCFLSPYFETFVISHCLTRLYICLNHNDKFHCKRSSCRLDHISLLCKLSSFSRLFQYLSISAAFRNHLAVTVQWVVYLFIYWQLRNNVVQSNHAPRVRLRQIETIYKNWPRRASMSKYAQTTSFLDYF